MKIPVFTLVLPAALGLACSHAQGSRTASASGQDEAGVATASADLKGHDTDRVVSGTVADASGSSLVIQSPTGERQTLMIVEETSVLVDGIAGRASDLKPGQEVRASFNEQSGEPVAVKVLAGSSGTGSTGAGSTDTPILNSPDSAASPGFTDEG
jgi:hypothetical protein